MHEVAVHRVAACQCALLPLHLVVHVVGVVLAHIVLPACSTSGRTSHSVVDAVLQTHRSALLEAVVSDDVVAEHVHVLLNHRAQVLHQVLHVLHEVRVDVGLQAADAVVVLDEASAGGLLHHVEHVLAVAHAIEERGQGTEVLSTARGVEQVRVETLQLVHDGANVLDAVGELNAHAFLDDTHQCMTVLHGTQVVQTVGQGQCLRVGHRLPHLLNTTMNVAQMRIDALHGLTVEHSLQAEHTMRGRVLRANVHHIGIVFEERILLACKTSVLVYFILQAKVGLHIFFQRILVVACPVLAEGMALEVVAQEQTAHVGMAEEEDSIEVENLTLQQVSHAPEVDDRGDDALAVHHLCQHLHRAALVCLGVLQDVDAAQALFSTEVLADDGHQVVETLLVFQICHLSGKLIKVECQKFQFHAFSSCSFLMFSTNSSGTSVTTMVSRLWSPSFSRNVSSSFETPSSRSFFVCLWLAPPKNFSIFTLRCSCIMP